MGACKAAALLLLLPLAMADYPAAKGHSSYGKGGGEVKYKIEPAGHSEEFKWAGPGYHVSRARARGEGRRELNTGRLHRNGVVSNLLLRTP